MTLVRPTWVRLVIRCAFRSRKWQLIGMS